MTDLHAFANAFADNQAHMSEQINKIQTDVEAMKNDLDEKKKTNPDKNIEKAAEAAHLMGKSALGVAEGIADAVHSFQSGNNVAGTMAIMDILGSAVSLAALAGPVGGLISAVLGPILEFVKFILSFFLPPQKSLLDQIKELLIKMNAEAKEDELEGLILQSHLIMTTADRYLKASVNDSEYLDWATITNTFKVFDQVKTVGSVLSWMKRGSNIESPQWEKVFAAYVGLINQQVINFHLFMLMAKPGKDRYIVAGQAQDHMKVYKNDFKTLLPTAQNKGTTVHLGTGSAHGSVFSRSEAVSENDWSSQGGDYRQVFVDGNGRFWAVNSNRELFTKKGSNWVNAKANRRFDFLSVKTDSDKKVTVWGIDKTNVSWPYHSNTWNEQSDKWERAEFYIYVNSQTSVKEFHGISVTSDGKVFALRKNDIYVPFGNTRTDNGSYFVSLDSRPSKGWIGMSATVKRVFLYTKKDIYYFLRSSIAPGKTMNLHKMEAPGRDDIVSLFAADDGTLLAVLTDEKMRLYRSSTKWVRNGRGDAFFASKKPVDNWGVFSYLLETGFPNLANDADRIASQNDD